MKYILEWTKLMLKEDSIKMKKDLLPNREWLRVYVPKNIKNKYDYILSQYSTFQEEARKIWDLYWFSEVEVDRLVWWEKFMQLLAFAKSSKLEVIEVIRIELKPIENIMDDQKRLLAMLDKLEGK